MGKYKHLFLLHAMLVAMASAQLTAPSSCGSTTGCFSKCDGGSCTFVVTWSDTGSSVDFSLSLSRQTSADEWISLGLSSDDKMGVDSVTDCIMNNGQAAVQRSYNVAKYNEVLATPKEGISSETTSTADNVLRCTFSLSKSGDGDRIFDLTSDWYLLVAHGAASGGSILRHSLSPRPDVSSSKVDLQSNDIVGATGVNILVKLHGTFMMFAWMFCVSIGIVLARYYKTMWPQGKICAEKVWFTFHRLCMVTAFLFCVAAFVIIFLEKEGWSHLEGHTNWQRAHPYIGVVITFCAVLNPLMAIFRPHPDQKNRKLFNWAHWFVGTFAHILSIIAIILGVTIGIASVPFYCVWILLAWACYQFFVVLCMELHECYFSSPKRKRYSQYGTYSNPPGSTLKKLFIGLHVFIITGLTAACIIIVAIN